MWGLIGASSGTRAAISMPAFVRPSSLAGLLVSSTIRVQFRVRSIIARNAIVALIVLEAQHRVGVARIEPAVLQSIGPHLVRKADAAAFLGQVQNDAAAEAFQAREREPKLVATVASPGAEHVAGQACRMKPNRNRFGKIGLADDDGHLIDAESVPKHDKARRRARRQRN